MTGSTSTSIRVSWHLPPADSRNGIIKGFKLFYKKKGSEGTSTTLTIKDGATRSKDVTGLDKYTEYEFEVLAYTSVGDGPKSSLLKRTDEDGKMHNENDDAYLSCIIYYRLGEINNR